MASKSNNKVKTIDLLEVDPIIKGQEYVLFSFVSQKHIKNAKINAFKFRGAFSDETAARAYAKKLQDMDGDHNIYIGEGFKWVPYDPDDDTIDDHEYYETELNNIMKSHKEQIFEKKKLENEHKNKLIEKSLLDNTKTLNKTQEKLRNKLAKKKINESINEEKGEIQDKDKIVNADDNIKQLDSGLDKLQEVYKKMLEKQEMLSKGNTDKKTDDKADDKVNDKSDDIINETIMK